MHLKANVIAARVGPDSLYGEAAHRVDWYSFVAILSWYTLIVFKPKPMKQLFILFFTLTLLSTGSASAQSINTRIVKDSLFIPWEILWGPDNNIWLTQKNGYICRLHPTSGVLDTLYHEPATVIQSEGGMLGMALHPQFATQPYVYVVYDYLNSSNVYRERVVRYTYNGSNALGSPQILLDNVNAAVNHNGSRLLIIGDKLYITTGDALTMSNAQSNASPNGKIHRINLDGTIPADNPIPGNTLWSKGHRNPQGMVYANGFLYSSEHGNTTDDEVNIIRKGRNFGWPAVEGFCNTTAEQQFCTDSNVVEPLYAWTPTLAVCGIDYYGGATPPYTAFTSLAGSLIMCTLKDQHLYQLKLNAAKDSIVSAGVINGVSFGRLRDICISPQGKIYISTSNSPSSGTGALMDRIVELSDPNATNGVGNLSAQGIRIYPNPARHFLVVEGLKGNASYRILDLSGRLLHEGQMQVGSGGINVGAMAPGNYLLEIPGIGAQIFSRE